MKRPLGVTVIGVLMVLEGLPLGLLAATALAVRLDALPMFIPPDVARQFELAVPTGLLAAVIWGGLGLLLLFGGVGMLLVRPWAWLLAMVLHGVTLANFLYGYSVGHENYAGMVLSVVVVFYLNSRSVRLAFDFARRRARGVEGPGAPSGASPAAKAARRAEIPRSLPRRRRHRPTTKEIPR